jgi:hypothetical protein
MCLMDFNITSRIGRLCTCTFPFSLKKFIFLEVEINLSTKILNFFVTAHLVSNIENENIDGVELAVELLVRFLLD